MSQANIFLRQYRKRLKITQKRFARNLTAKLNRNISREQMANWETGRVRVPGDVILLLKEIDDPTKLAAQAAPRPE